MCAHRLAVVALAICFNEGIILKRLGGINTGHVDLLAMIDRWLTSLETARHGREDGRDASALP